MEPGPMGPQRLFEELRAALAFDPTWPDGDWPVRWEFRPDSFEIAVGSVLTQNIRWENVERALEGLARASLADPDAILTAGPELERVIRPAGFYRHKSATLRRLARLWRDAGERVPERSELLAVRGIGPETADAICLYAARRPEFIADAYTRRLAARMGFLASDAATYEGVKGFFEGRLERNADLFRRFHALIVQHGKRFCRKRPLCRHCPLRRECPAATDGGERDTPEFP